MKKRKSRSQKLINKDYMPSPEKVQKELSTVDSIDDFFGKEGVFSKLFAKTIENMMEAEITDHLGYEKHSSIGIQSGNNRNGTYKRKINTQNGINTVLVPRDRNGEYSPTILKKYQKSTNEIEKKITVLYAKGNSTREIKETVEELYGVNVSKTLISQITDKVLPLVEEWQNRSLEPVYTIIFLDCIFTKIKKNNKVKVAPVYTAIGINLEGKKEVLGHWIGEGGEGSSFWLKVVTEIKNRGVEDIMIACVDGLANFSQAITSVYPDTIVQRCIIHQIRNSLKYVSWKDKKEFINDLKKIYKAATKDEAETYLEELEEKWADKYGLSVRSWRENWDELSVYFEFTPEIRKVIYTTNLIEGYYRMIRKVTKKKAVFPTDNSVRKMYYLATMDITKKWTMPVHNWSQIINQLAIKFEDRLKKWLP